MKRKAAMLVATMLAMVGVVFGVQAPAQAVGPCYANSICFFNTPTTHAHFNNCDVADCNIGPSDCRTISPITSFISNTSNKTWVVSTSTNCTGYRATIYANSSGPMTGMWNNSIRSFYRSS